MNSALKTPEPFLAEPGKRTKILEAARALFAQKRYDEITVPEIVKLAGVAQGTFYRYFPSKTFLVDALTEQVSQHVSNSLAAVIQKDAPLLEALETIVRTAIATLESYRDIMPFLNTDALLFGQSDDAMRQRSPYLEMIESFIARDQQRKRIPKSINPRLTARLIDAVMAQVARDCILQPETLKVEAYVDEAIAFMKRALGEPVVVSKKPKR